MKPGDSAFVIIRNPSGNIAFTERADPVYKPDGTVKHVAGAFDLPGGGYDPDKDDGNPAITASREVREETGIHPLPEELTPLGVFYRKNGTAVHYFEYYMEAENILNISPENPGFQWVTYEELNTLPHTHIITLHRDVATFRLNYLFYPERLGEWHGIDGDLWILEEEALDVPRFAYLTEEQAQEMAREQLPVLR